MATDFARLRTVGTELQQILVGFFDDEGDHYWHHRLLVVEGDPGIWIVSTPTLGIQRIDWNEHGVPALPPVAAFSAEVGDQLFSLDPAITDAELAEVKGKAQALASIVGFARLVIDGATAGAWDISDPTSEAYGVVVPMAALICSDVCGIRGHCGMVSIDQRWLAMENIGSADIAIWQRAKWSGPARDARLTCHVTVGGRTRISEKMEVPVLVVWASGTQQDVAAILAQARLLQEERGHGDKRHSEKGDHDMKKDKDKDKKKPGGVS